MVYNYGRFLRFSTLLVLASATLFAQGDRGTITGMVVDTSGNAIVGAAVGIVNPVNNLSLKTVSNETGNYRLIGVPVGTWELTASAPGFQGAALWPCPPSFYWSRTSRRFSA